MSKSDADKLSQRIKLLEEKVLKIREGGSLPDHIEDPDRQYENQKKTFRKKFERRVLANLLADRKYVWVSLIVVTIGLIGLFSHSIISGRYGDLPSSYSLKHINQAFASEIYTRDGVLMGRYFLENRSSIRNEQVPIEMIHALIAAEDIRYFGHNGIDFVSLFRVFFRSILMGDQSSGGGSTITQQLAKNLYPRRKDGVIALVGSKIREMIIAHRLEDLYSKEQLLIMYLNTVPFGENTFGIKNAAQLYFNRLPTELSTEQSITLVGMLKGTSTYNPNSHPDKALKRRNVVIGQMLKYGFVNEAEKDNLMNKPLEIDYNPIDHNHGIAPYLREYLRPRLEQWCKNHFKQNGDPYNLYTDGLKFYTTIDSRLQKYAEEAVAKHMPAVQKLFDQQASISDQQQYRTTLRKILNGIQTYQDESIWDHESLLYQQKPTSIFTWDGTEIREMSPVDSVKHYLSLLNAGFMAMDPHSGAVLAWVGGIDHQFFKYDHVTSKRQVGSTFKPIVYANALRNGLEPCHYFLNEKTTYKDFQNWTPKNANYEYGGVYSLQNALVNSVNTVSVQVLLKSGIESTIQLAKKMGITSEIPSGPSLGLGTVSASVMEMAEVYSGFANGGKRVKGSVLLRVEDTQGNVLERLKNDGRRAESSIDRKSAELVTMMLREVVDKGTARSLSTNYLFSGDVAGKTGTTQRQSDGWFVGYTPNLVFASWVGAEYPFVHFGNLRNGQGASTAMPIIGNFLEGIYIENPDSRYFGKFKYSRINSSEYDCVGYFDEDNVGDIEDKIHYIETRPGLAGCWFGTSRFDEVMEDKLTLRDIDINWGKDHKGHKDWAIAWRGQIEAPHSGRVRFTAESSGKVRLLIGEEIVMYGRRKSSGSITMEKGKKYPITLTHAQAGRGAHLQVFWEWEGHEKNVITGNFLSHNQRDLQMVKRKEVVK